MGCFPGPEGGGRKATEQVGERRVVHGRGLAGQRAADALSRPSVLVVAEHVAEGMGHHPVAIDRGEQVGGRHLTERRSNRRP